MRALIVSAKGLGVEEAWDITLVKPGRQVGILGVIECLAICLLVPDRMAKDREHEDLWTGHCDQPCSTEDSRTKLRAAVGSPNATTADERLGGGLGLAAEEAMRTGFLACPGDP